MKTRKDGIAAGLHFLAWLCCALLMIFALWCVFFNQHGVNRKEFDFGNLTYTVCALLLVAAAWPLLGWWNRFRYDRRLIALGCVCLFVLQRLITHTVIFGTGWDAGGVVNFAWRIATEGIATDWESYYLSVYPNNTIIILLYSLCIRLRMLFGEALVRRDVLLTLTVVNSVVSCVTAYCVYRLAQLITKDKRTALLAWLAYCLLIAFSPWILIPYSDSLALGFPVWILYVYFNDEMKRGKWFLIGVLSYLGFRIKPAVAVALIAIVICELIDFIRGQRRMGIARAMAALLTAALLAHAGYLALPRESVGWKVDEEMAMGMPHYIMMGLNEETVGGYWADDASFSSAILTKAERTRANLEEAFRRLKKMGPDGYLRFLADKNAINFHDGTFAWGHEGDFMRVVFDVEQTRAVRILRSIFYPDGDRHHHLMNLLQVGWMGVLIGQTASMMGRNRKKKELLTFYLCFAGILLYALMFESRARYLYVFVPVMIVTACTGYADAAARIKGFLQKKGICQGKEA